MKIKSIYIDGLHNAVNKTYEFGDISYIYGNNGVGKSTILQAIQFALLGYIPGTAKNSKEAILRHSPIGNIEVKLTLVSDNGNEIIVHRNTNKNGNFKSITPDNPNCDIDSIIKELELPIFNFNEFVGQTANKLKEYFIKNILPTSNGELDWRAILEDSLNGHNFEDKEGMINYGLFAIRDIEGSPLDQVIAANTIFKSEQSFNKSELQRLQNTIDSLIYYDDYTGPTDLDDINSKLLELNSLRDQIIKYESVSSATRSAQDELTRLNADITALGGKDGYDNANLQLSQLKQKYKDLSDAINTRTTALVAMRATDAAADTIIQSQGVCPYTKEACKSIASKIEDLRNESVKRKAHNVALSEEIDSLNGELNNIHINIRKCESTINDFQTIWNRIVTLEKTIVDLPQRPDTDKSVFDLDVEISILTENRSKLQANIKYNETIDTITKLKFESELQSNALAAWVKKTDTNGLQTTLMTRPFEELATTMTGYIQQMYNRNDITAHFNISSKANSFSFGLIREGVYIPYDLLSSGEKCLYSLALMICITNNNNSPLKILLCDDMFDHLDQNAIESTFATLKNLSGIQFIFAGVKECQNAKDVVLQV